MSPAEIAAGVAADIRKYGHAQSSRDCDGGKCCFAVSPFLEDVEQAGRKASDIMPYRTALAGALDTDPLGGIVHWNDTHTTAEVLAVLDQLAATS